MSNAYMYIHYTSEIETVLGPVSGPDSSAKIGPPLQWRNKIVRRLITSPFRSPPHVDMVWHVEVPGGYV